MRTPTILLVFLLAAASGHEVCAQQAGAIIPSSPPELDSLQADTKADAKTDSKADSKDDADKPAKPKTPPSKLDPNSSLFVELGYGDWGLRGNQSKFRQYATPPSGFFLRDLRYAPILKSPSENAFFELRGIGQDDYYATAKGAWDYGATRLSGFTSRSQFFDPSAGAVPQSSWRSSGVDLRRNINRDFALSFQVRSNSQQLYYTVPYPRLNQNTDYWSLLAAGKLGKGYASLEYSGFHYADETASLINFDSQKVGLSYLWTPTRTLQIEASGSHVGVKQPNLPESHVDTLALGGNLVLGPATDLDVQLQHRQVALPNVQNAYVRNQNVGAFSISHRFNSWRAQLALLLQNDDRVNGTQTYVDVPKWSTLDARLSGRLNPNFRLSFHAYTQSLSDPPASTLSDASTLYWTNRNFAEAKLEGGTENVNGYLVYTYRVNRNSQRSTDVTTEQYTLGATWQVNPRLSLFGEFHHESWTGRTDITEFPITSATLNNFLPNSDTSAVELNWNLGRRAYVSLNYTGFASYNDNPLLLQDGNTRGSFVTLNTHYRFPAGYELGLLVAPWTYHDRVANSLDYNATVLMITGSARF